MTVAIELNTPLADALNAAIQPKLEEYGWATGGGDDAALTEYIILMLVNNKTQNEVAQELSADLLGLDPNDAGLLDFCNWLFSTIDSLAVQFGASNAQSGVVTALGETVTADGDQDMDMSSANDGPSEFNAYVIKISPSKILAAILTLTRPTGPKAMRNGGGETRGRGKRMMGQINRAMDRTHESVLHRVRGSSGNERINTHNRAPPTGPRMGAGRLPRGGPNTRPASIQHGLANMQGMNPAAAGMNGAMGGMGGMAAWGMMPGQPPQADVMALLQQQQQMLSAMQQQLMHQNGGKNGGFNGQGRGKPQHPNQRGNFRGRGGHQQNGHNSHSSEGPKADTTASQGEDIDMSGAKREPVNPEDTICRFNLTCSNKDCKFAHQSPAAPRGITIDVNDVCSFGAACKNFKCVGRHPSPATKAAHQSELDCKFWPNCQNPHCLFKHPSKPPCRNGGDCKTPACEFYHTTVMCKFKPCTNRFCTFKHEDGQRGTFADKVWTADGTKEHVSERKFADDKVKEEEILPGGADDAMGGTEEAAVAG